MIRRHAKWIVFLLTALTAAPRAHAVPIVLPKPGQVGFALQGQYGTMFSGGNLGSEFGDGGGLTVRVRYRMRYERAIGISFESQTLNARSAPVADTSRTKLNMQLSGVDFYQMFNTDQKLQQMLSLGVGLAQLHYSLRDGETEYPEAGDGVYLSLGGGLERFFYRSMAVDASLRYIAIFENSKANHDLQAALGVIFYASY